MIDKYDTRITKNKQTNKQQKTTTKEKQSKQTKDIKIKSNNLILWFGAKFMMAEILLFPKCTTRLSFLKLIVNLSIIKRATASHPGLHISVFTIYALDLLLYYF